MTTLAVDTPRAYQTQARNHVGCIANDIVYEGAAVGDNGSGYGRPLVAGDPFLGFCVQNCDNTAVGAAAGDRLIEMRTEGRIQLAVSGAAITDVGKPVYASDDAVFTLTAGSNSLIGRIVRFVSTGVVIVEFEVGRGGVGKLAALTENGGAVGGSNDGDLPDLTATYVARTSAGGGTADGAYEDEGVVTTAGGNTYADAAVNTVVAKLKNNIKELATVVAQLAADNVALRAADREIATKINAIVAEDK